MADTSIFISANEFSGLRAEPSSVPVKEGDSVTFTASEDVSASLYFSPDALSILSPEPSNPVEVDDTDPITFDFTGSGPGNFYVAVTNQGADAVTKFPLTDPGSVLQIFLLPLPIPIQMVGSSPSTPHQE